MYNDCYHIQTKKEIKRHSSIQFHWIFDYIKIYVASSFRRPQNYFKKVYILSCVKWTLSMKCHSWNFLDPRNIFSWLIKRTTSRCCIASIIFRTTMQVIWTAHSLWTSKRKKRIILLFKYKHKIKQLCSVFLWHNVGKSYDEKFTLCNVKKKYKSQAVIGKQTLWQFVLICLKISVI